MKESTLIEFGNQFIKRLAAQYQLPELRDARFTTSKVVEDGIIIKTDEIEAEPTGQLACIVKMLTVRVEIGASSNGRHIRGTIHYHYSHHNGGSNGSEQSFLIITESRYGEPEYAGAISEQLAYSYRQQLSPAS